MSDRARQSYEQWKQADAAARQAEVRLARAWDEYFANKGQPPTAAMIQEVSQLRAVANDRLTAAMVLMSLPPREGSDSQPPSQPPSQS